METEGDIWSLLCNASKLCRDQGEERLRNTLTGGDAQQTEQVKVKQQVTRLAQTYSSEQRWEARLGFLIGAKIYVASEATQVDDDLRRQLVGAGIVLLVDDEVRVRDAAGQLLGALCAKLGPVVYEEAGPTTLELIKQNLEREEEMEANRTERGDTGGGRTAESIFHDTAGWKNLESSIKCLQYMVEGCGEAFQPHLDGALMDLVRTSLGHTNRFVREAGYYTVTSFVKTGAANGDAGIAHRFSEDVAKGLADNWSQVRLSASVACRQLLLSVADAERREEFYPTLLPRLCLNRYYMAEGVKLYCQETWKLAVGDAGKSMVEKYISHVVEYYVECTTAGNHAVREAACQCIAELAAKIDKTVLAPHVDRLLNTLLDCFKDDSWPVRDTACVAAGTFVRSYASESEGKLDTLFNLFLTNLKDPISSVRQGAAIAIANCVRAYEDAVFDRVVNVMKQGFSGLKEQPVESERYRDLSNTSDFGVVKQLRDNDVALHENQPMYSCGSLAPKMGRGGGCSDSRFQKPSEPWELADGCVHLLAELTASAAYSTQLAKLLVPLSDSTRVRHYTMHFALLATVLKRLPAIAENLGKRQFKPFLEEFMDGIFYACESDNGLAKAAGEQVVVYLNDYLGPNIFRGRVEQYHPRYLNVIERILVAGEPMQVSAGLPFGAQATSAIPIARPRRDESEEIHLGGTPT